MDSNFTTCFEKKNCTYKYIPSAERSATVNYLSMEKNSKIAQKVKQFLLLSSLLSSYISFQNKCNGKSLKVLRIETWFQWHSGIHLQKMVWIHLPGNLMKYVIECGLIQVTTHGVAQNISKLQCVGWSVQGHIGPSSERNQSHHHLGFSGREMAAKNKCKEHFSLYHSCCF